jgi:hypothetical protein
MHKKHRTRLRKARRKVNKIQKDLKEVLPILAKQLTEEQYLQASFNISTKQYLAVQALQQAQQEVLKSQKR